MPHTQCMWARVANKYDAFFLGSLVKKIVYKEDFGRKLNGVFFKIFFKTGR